jgi:hypothetical protein
MKRNVSVACICSAPNCCDTEQRSTIQLGSVASGTPYIKKNTDALVIASLEIGLEENDDKTKDTVMSKDLNAGQSHSIEIDNSSFERVEYFKYLETT